jgi:hypothetical protein
MLKEVVENELMSFIKLENTADAICLLKQTVVNVTGNMEALPQEARQGIAYTSFLSSSFDLTNLTESMKSSGIPECSLA